ncbi:L,D-transpeptidase [uncultured Chryseobacterium sp.]|uniref:L,D-transpeptidase n=1 Tax=uncultured Chryseobacterium sp. TaxID=259322 RepID=UPI0025D5FDA5|nr:L,D-transpeptidase [uncultured Chryseobacterium sp.]
MAVVIANARMAPGDISEGAAHEYYVTADVVSRGIQKASPNMNVANPMRHPDPPLQNKLPERKAARPPKAKPVPEKPKPHPDSPKFPVTTGGESRRDDREQLLQAEFVDAAGKRLHSSRVGSTAVMKITARNMNHKKVRVKVWEQDNLLWTHDLIYDSSWILTGDENYIRLQLTKKMFDKARDGGTDSSRQDYFIEVIHHETSVTSEVLPVSLDAVPMKAEKGRSVSVVDEPEQTKTGTTCICKEQYRDLVWGGKVSCEFRRKVVEISKRQGFDADNFMTAMAHETGGTFDPTCGTFKKHKNEEKEGYVGLIQIGKDAAKNIGTTRSHLIKMNQIDQLDYVEKYLAKKKGKLNTLSDFYLAILFPIDCGKGNEPNHIVFDNSLPISYKNGKLIKDLNYWRNVAYSANPIFHKEGKEESGKTYVWEITKNIQIWYEKEKNNKVQNFICDKKILVTKPLSIKGTWNVVVTEKYTGSKCKHIEKTPVRPNCRRGKIEVYDHNGKEVLSISDCLLEGIAGENRNITDSDAPFGTYQISSAPFIMGSSSGDKRTSYGPNPRLSFEPIKGSGDEADKSGRSLIRIHGGRQETKIFTARTNPNLLRTHGCIRIWDSDAKRFYDWWVEYHTNYPNIKPGKLILKR